MYSEIRHTTNKPPSIRDDIGKIARLGDVWYEIMDVRLEENRIEYKLYSREEWIQASWIKYIKNKEDI